MRNGRLHEAFSVDKEPGLSDFLAGRVSLGEIIVSLPDVGVDFIPRGSMVLNPAELLVLGNLAETLEQLKSFYNHIVIDSPPILGATDAAILGKHADATFPGRQGRPLYRAGTGSQFPSLPASRN